jgi:hypothetical protein
MKLTKLVHPNGEVRTFTAEHAKRILAYQESHKMPPSKCFQEYEPTGDTEVTGKRKGQGGTRRGKARKASSSS